MSGLLLITALPPLATGQDFDPAGRRHRKVSPATPPPKDATGAGTPSRTVPAGRPKSTSPNDATDGNGAASGPGVAALIARYTAVVLAQPTSPFPLQRLVELYRQRDGHLRELVLDFEKRAHGAGGDRFAARLALGAIDREDGRLDDAAKILQEAAAERPTDAAPLRALAELSLAQNDPAGARAYFEKVLLLVRGQDREQMLRSLITVALDSKDFEAAKRFHRELVRQSQGSLLVRGELGRALESRGEYALAETEFRDAIQAASGDNRALAPALRDLGRVLARERKGKEALAVLRQALSAAGGQAGVRGEIFALITEVYRAENNLVDLIKLLEEAASGDVQRIVALGALYEETGQVDKALVSYRRALAAAPRNIDVRLKLIHLLQAQGELEQATREYEALIRAAPHNPDYVFELCETLIQRGERPRALGLLGELERRAASDEDVLVRLADFYERVDEKQKSIAVLTKLSTIAPGDPSHLVELGDRFYQQGDRKKAIDTWNRIKIAVPNRAKALAALGEVYLDHDMPVEGVDALKEAVLLDGQNVPYLKAYAVALERTATAASASALATARFEEAKAIWEALLSGSKSDKNLAREARTHIVTLYSLLHQLEQQIVPLELRFAMRPPDLDAGRLLAEVQIRLHRLSDAGRTLGRVTELAPGDTESFLALERVLVLEQNLAGAIAVLEKLVELDPKRAREFFQRMAQYAAELYRDDDAIKFAARAVQLSPEDAEGHRKLGEMYSKKQDSDGAILEFRAAIAKNDKLFPVYFELAELLLARGDAEEADRLFRRVVRAAPDDELVSQAARQSMQINLGRGTLETLEQDLLPAAIGNPRKPVYRRLLVELYGAMAFPLIQQVRHGQGNETEAARAALRTIGTRAIKPLLDALADDKDTQQRTAVDLLAFVENRSAGPPLFAFATGHAEQPLRLQAMIACGALRDPSLLPKYESLLLPKDETAVAPGDPVSVAAAWSVARLGDRRSSALLFKLLGKSTPDLRALAAIGLGLQHDKRSIPELALLARSVDAGNGPRAAAAFALGELKASDAASVLVTMAESAEVLPRQAALLALARLGSPAAPSIIADSVLAADPAVRESAVLAALVLQTGDFRSPTEPLPVPDGAVDLRAILQGLAPSGYSAEERARALITHAPALRRAALASAVTTAERARALADALLARDGAPSFAPFTDGIETLPAPLRKEAEEAAESIATAVVPAFVLLERHPARDVRTRAIQFLARRPEDLAQGAMVDALADPDEVVQRFAIAAVGSEANLAVVKQAVAMLQRSSSWSLRVRAAEALGRIGASARAGAFAPLAEVARADSYALVREAAMRALARVDAAAARPILREIAARDAESRLRTLATELEKSAAR